MYEDFTARISLYVSDFDNICNLKVGASVLFMFFTSIGPGLTFANLLDEKTDQTIGVIEVMFSTALCGIMASLLFGQPLVIVGVTGPVSILTIAIYDISKSWGLNFLPFYAWSQIWAGIMLIIQAVWNHCDMVYWITRFSCEIFGVLIALLYIYNGLEGIAQAFVDKGTESGCFQMIVSLGMLWMSIKLSAAKKWVILDASIRQIIADYGPSMALIFWTGVVYFPGAKDVNIDILDVPNEFGTTNGRNWIVDMSDIETWGIFAAILPGFIICVLFFFDHNVSSLMCQSKEFNLKKPSAFHWDYFIVGLSLILTGILGIPPTNGLIPQAPLHTKSLIVYKEEKVEVENPETKEITIETKLATDGVYEQRASNLFTSLLIGLMCFRPFLQIISLVPVAALSGLFLFMGISSFDGNQFFERLCILFTEQDKRRSDNAWFTGYAEGDLDEDGKVIEKAISGAKDDRTRFEEMRTFTVLQLGINWTIFGITFTPAAMVFPVLIGILVPLRLAILPEYLSTDSLELFDHAIANDHVNAQGGDARLVATSDADDVNVEMTTIESGQNNTSPLVATNGETRPI